MPRSNLSQGIRIDAVGPGLFWTPMDEQRAASGQSEALDALLKAVPMGRYGRAEEVADVVLWFCSDASSYVTGQSISVHGDFIMRAGGLTAAGLRSDEWKSPGWGRCATYRVLSFARKVSCAACYDALLNAFHTTFVAVRNAAGSGAFRPERRRKTIRPCQWE